MNNEETLIKVDGLSKKFCRDLKQSLWYGVKDITRELAGLELKKELRKNEFWALDDVSFEVKRGECLGLIGRNGAGKSSMLKLLTNLIKPDKGQIEMKGRVTALIELGSGFNPILTGRENIFINASVLGFKKREVDELLEEIIEFSEIEEFIDTPVQYYSSGMKVRLGFSVAVHMKPDILILDEVLAVGDAGFKIKSINKMHEMMNDAAVIFVNHSMTTISRICNKVMFLEGGKVKYQGSDIMEGVQNYLTSFQDERSHIAFNGDAQFEDVDLSVKENRGTNIKGDPLVEYLDTLLIRCKIRVNAEFSKISVNLTISNKDLVTVAAHHTQPIDNSGELHHILITLPDIGLTNGEYAVTFKVIEVVEKEEELPKNLAVYRHWRRFQVSGLKKITSVPYLMNGDLEEIEVY